ncbi:MAG: hypothetical protein WD737_14505, partial [Gemmatimonadota bacterium]
MFLPTRPGCADEPPAAALVGDDIEPAQRQISLPGGGQQRGRDLVGAVGGGQGSGGGVGACGW